MENVLFRVVISVRKEKWKGGVCASVKYAGRAKIVIEIHLCYSENILNTSRWDGCSETVFINCLMKDPKLV